MFLWHRKIFKSCQFLAELMQNVEGPHLSHRNGPTLSIKHAWQHHRRLRVVTLPKLLQGEDVKAVYNKLRSISIAHLICPILDTPVRRLLTLVNHGTVRVVGTRLHS